MLDVTAREVPIGGGDSYGMNIALKTGDHSSCDSSKPLCDRGGYNNYTVEVNDRMGTDSFTPDSGVLIAKTKDVDSAPFIWVIDANPQDINMTDFIEPDGDVRKITIGDYRQLADAAFHAGTSSGSEFEYVDKANRLHFYILDNRRDSNGVLHYVVAVRSLDGSGPHKRGVQVGDGLSGPYAEGQAVHCQIPVKNTGKAKDVSGTQPEDVSDLVDADVYRVSAEAAGGWDVWLPRKVVGIDNGDTMNVDVYAAKKLGSADSATITVKIQSESDGSVKGTGTCKV
jgi:hypothetical protein